MNHYTDPDGRLWSRRELTALVKGWRVPKPLPRVQTYGAVDVVREDEREYGTKSRLLDALMSATDAREFVYGSSSATGLGGLALPDACRRHHRRCRVFLAKRDYPALARAATRLVRAGGILLACCNAAGLPGKKFREDVRNGIRLGGRKTLKSFAALQPPDFPATANEPAHLKVSWLQLD